MTARRSWCPGDCAMHHACACPDKLDRHPSGNVADVGIGPETNGVILVLAEIAAALAARERGGRARLTVVGGDER